MVWPLIFLIIILVIGFPFISSAIAQFQDEQKQTQEDRNEAKSIGNNAQVGDIVCTLYVEVRGELDVDKGTNIIKRFFVNQLPNFEALYVYIGEGTYYPDGALAHWDHCYQKGSTANSILPIYLSSWQKGLEGADELGNEMSVVSVGNSFTLEMRGVSDTSSRLMTSGGKTSTWSTKVEIPDFKQITVPYPWKADMVATEVLADDYAVTIRASGDTKPFTFSVKRPLFG